MTTAFHPHADTYHPFGLPLGTVRGFISVLICSFFWIFLLLPAGDAHRPPVAPLGHFFLLTLVFLAFASHPHHAEPQHRFLPWLMRTIFVGGSLAVVAWVAYQEPERLSVRLTPAASEIGQWPVLLATLSGGFAVGLFARYVLGRNNELFQTLRGWTGVIAMLLLLAETVFQFAVRPSLNGPPSDDVMKVWEGILIAFVAAYFGTRA